MLSLLRKVAVLVALSGAATIGSVVPAGAAAPVQVHAGQSIASAIDRAGSGGTVVVHAGVYPALTLTTRTWSPPVTVRAASGDIGNVVLGGVALSGVSGLNVRDVVVTSGTTVNGGANITVATSRLVYITVSNGATDVTIVGNQITGGTNGVGITNWNGAAHPTRIRVAGNTIAGQAGDNIQIGIADDVVIEDNVLRDTTDNANHNDGIQMMGGTGLVVRRNRIFGGQDEGIILKPESVLGTSTQVIGARVENNLIHDTRGAGIILVGTSATSVVNNTVYDTPYASVHLEGANTGLAVWNNLLEQIYLVSGATAPSYEDFNCVGSGGHGAHDVKSDPQLVDHTSYRLSLTSPCVDLGELAGAPTVDLDGAARINRPDAGALETR